MSEDILNNKNLHHDLMLLYKIKQTIFLQKDNVFKELFGFHALNYVLKYMHVLFLQYIKVHIRY